MLYLGISILRSKMPSKTRKGNYVLGVTMGLTNPFQIIWWLTYRDAPEEEVKEAKGVSRMKEVN